MSVKYSAKGVLIKHGLTAAPATNLAQVKSVGISVGDVSLVDVTTHDSATTKDYVHPLLRDTASFDITLEWDPADVGHEAVRAAHAAGTLYYFTAVMPDADAAQWALSGYITSFSPPTLTPEGALEVTLKYKAKTVDTYTQ